MGTGHALACCKGVVNGPFAVINADDFYGRTAFSEIYDFLAAQTDEHKYAMVGYRLKNTVTEFGSVARGAKPNTEAPADPQPEEAQPEETPSEETQPAPEEAQQP